MRIGNVIIGIVLASITLARAGERPDLWLYYPVNILPGENLDKLDALWRRAAAAGYNHVLLADSKSNRLADMPKAYFQNCERVKALARELHMQIVPAEFDIGYSNDLLSHDPNLAEGLPVKDTPFVVHDGQARCEGDPWIELAKPSFKDDSVHIESGVATDSGHSGNARFVYALKVPQYRCYHVSVEIKTDHYTGQPEIHPLAGERTLCWQTIHTQPSQDWSRQDLIFDSLDNTSVNLYFGVWGDAKGTLAWRNWRIEQVGLLNVLRRDGAPCVVTTDEGKPLVEGKDYDRIEDPHMGNVPYAGEYQAWHEPPAIHTRLPDGTKLRVSWYFPPIVYDGQVSACISEPRTTQILADEAKRMRQVWAADGYMMSFDEFRCCNWDESCAARKKTPGQMLAESLRFCTKLVAPQQAYTWNDMFDPFHNAVQGPYYLVNGPWTGSWEGLDPKVIILNWNHGKRDQSLKFFADRGNRQILCGFYDNDLSEWQQWLDSGKNVKGIVGHMYTTWRGDYSQIEKFAQMSRSGEKNK
jgi:hypothetical protein